jgi:hypothetical protein
MKIFHQHRFDPTTWKELSNLDVYEKSDPCKFNWATYCSKEVPKQAVIAKIIVHSNTCLKCGMLITKETRIAYSY